MSVAMKSHRRIKNIIRLGIVIAAVTMPMAIIGCEFGPSGSPLFDLMIENQTNQTLTIYVDSRGDPTGIAEPGKVITTGIDGNRGRYLITAKNVQGEIVFSETYTFMPDDKYHLQQTDEVHEGVVAVYKAVIPSMPD